MSRYREIAATYKTLRQFGYDRNWWTRNQYSTMTFDRLFKRSLSTWIDPKRYGADLLLVPMFQRSPLIVDVLLQRRSPQGQGRCSGNDGRRRRKYQAKHSTEAFPRPAPKGKEESRRCRWKGKVGSFGRRIYALEDYRDLLKPRRFQRCIIY